MSFTEFVGVCVSLCMLGRRATLWERWRRFVVSWPTISAPTRSGGDRACSSGNLRPGECLSVFVCETVVQYVPLLLLTSQCVTHVSSSAARLDAMETYFLFANPSSLLYRHGSLPLTIQFYIDHRSFIDQKCIPVTHLLVVCAGFLFSDLCAEPLTDVWTLRIIKGFY